MGRTTRTGLLVCGGALVVAVLAGAAGGAGLQLFDAPRGAWLAEARTDASIQVLEERDGWKRVRIEGWVPDDALAAIAAPAGGADAAIAAAAAPGIAAAAPLPAAHGTGATIQGVLMPTAGMVPATVGASLPVLLIADVAKYTAEQQALVTSCRARIASQDAASEEAQRRLDAAFNSSGNFTEASRRNDRAKADLAAAKKARDEAVSACVDEADALAQRFAVARAPADTAGRFQFASLDPGTYRVFASEHREGAVRAWAFDATVTPGATVVLDPVTAAARDPYAGLR
jgi:hypothetical protein